MTAVHLTVWDETRAGADVVLLIHGTMTWGTACFEAQRPLARHYRLLVMDRRGFGECFPQYLAFAGEPLMACARISAEVIGAAHLCVPGAGHEPHRERPELVNTTLRDLWER